MGAGRHRLASRRFDVDGARAWAHRQIENSRPPADVLHDVLGPSGSSVAFVCIAVDLVLSHWPVMKGVAWPLLATPELLQYDHIRWSQDQSGMGRFFAQDREADHWPVKSGDLLACRRGGMS